MAENSPDNARLEQKDVDTWYCQSIEKIRITSTPGGEALSISEAKAFRDQLNKAIDTAEERETEDAE